MLRAEITVSLELDTKEKGSKLKQCKISEKVSLKTKNLDPPPLDRLFLCGSPRYRSNIFC